MISVYSFITAIAICNIFLILVYLLRRKKLFLYRYGTQVLLFIVTVAFARLFTPVDLEHAYIVRSSTILPNIQATLKSQISIFESDLTVGQAIVALWLIGTMAVVIKDVFVLWKHFLKRKQYHSVSCPRVDTLVRDLHIPYKVIVSPQVAIPHAVGILDPVIYLPLLELTEDEWTFVIEHEITHIRSCDLAIKLFYYFLEAVFWWNPVAHLFVKELDAILEYRCDFRVTDKLDSNRKIYYLNTMLSVMKQVMPVSVSSKSESVSFISSPIDIKQRFELVLQYDKNKFRNKRIMLYSAIVILFSLSYFVVIQPATYPSNSELEVFLPVTESASYIVFDGEEYSFYLNDQYAHKISESELNHEPYCRLEIIERR